MNIIYASDSKYFPHMVASIFSLLANNPWDKFDFYIMNHALSSLQFLRMRRLCNRPNVRFFDVKLGDNDMPKLQINHHFSIESYYRLLAPKKINVKKALYIDADTIIRGSLNSLYQQELYNVPLAAIVDPIIPRKPQLGMAKDASYFNSGVMLINMEIWRKNGIGEKAIHFANKHPELIEFVDQDALNRVINGNFIRMHPHFNAQSGHFRLCSDAEIAPSERQKMCEAISDPVIIHYTGGHRDKPWHDDNKHEFRELYWAYREAASSKIDRQEFSNQAKNDWGGELSRVDSTINKLKDSNATLLSKARLWNLYKQCMNRKGTGAFVECGVAKGGALALMAYVSDTENKVYGFDSFSGMPQITEEDIGEYNKSDPISGFGGVGQNLSGGVQSVKKTFNSIGNTGNNTTLIKGYFSDTLRNQKNKDKVGDIAVLRLDGDWYESVKIPLETLYDQVQDGGAIIVDDYGHFIGAKRAVDEFRLRHKILSPLHQSDYTEYFWIKGQDPIALDVPDIDADVWTISNTFRSDMQEFFRSKGPVSLLEIGSYKGFTTRFFSNFCNQVVAVDNNRSHHEHSRSLNKDRENIEYINLDIYKDAWDPVFRRFNINVIFIDADHSYEGVKSDIENSLRFEGVKYLIFDDYLVFPSVKKAVDEAIESGLLAFEQFCGLHEVPGLKGMHRGGFEGLIVSVPKVRIAEKY